MVNLNEWVVKKNYYNYMWPATSFFATRERIAEWFPGTAEFAPQLKQICARVRGRAALSTEIINQRALACVFPKQINRK